jgi:hypothetical protein
MATKIFRAAAPGSYLGPIIPPVIPNLGVSNSRPEDSLSM